MNICFDLWEYPKQQISTNQHVMLITQIIKLFYIILFNIGQGCQMIFCANILYYDYSYYIIYSIRLLEVYHRQSS